MRSFAESVVRACLLVLAALCSLPACAHKASDSYLQLDATPAGTTLRVDVALRDLDLPLDLDADADGRLTWAEVKAGWPRIERYVAERVDVEGCRFGAPARSLERRADGAYAALTFRSPCVLARAPAIAYAVLAEVDPTHRGIARISVEGQPATVRVLTPSTSTAVAARVEDTPTPWQFLGEGVRHILTGYDHVLFLLCLLLPSVMRRTPAGWVPVERLRDAVGPILGIVTAFTLAHSVTLGLAASGRVSLSPAFIEPAIAATIVLAALDNLWPIFRGRRVIVTFCFGLVHGFGFAGVLAELDLPATQFAWALLQFNLGLELGQLVIVAAATSLLFSLRGRRRYPAWVVRGGSVAAMLVATAWFVERVGSLSV